MQITFLGTGTSQGIPVIACPCEVCASKSIFDKRLRTSLFIEDEFLNLVIDSGPDFRQQMLANNISKLDAVLLTHAHKDHIGGLDDVRAFNYVHKKPMDVYAQSSVLKSIKSEFAYAFAKNKYPGVPKINLISIKNTPFKIDNLKITPIEVTHAEQIIFGFRIKDFTYITDASFISNSEKAKIKGTKTLVLNALRKTTHHSHFNLEQALSLIKEIKPERAYLTHISHLMGFHVEVQKELPNNVFLAYDGLKIEL